MREELDQSQIDALLGGLFGGKALAKAPPPARHQVQEYNFKIPKRFTRDQMRTLLRVFEIYARHLSAYLTSTLHTLCQAEVRSLKETKYYEYANAMPETALLGILHWKPMPGSVVMEFSKELSFVMIDKLLGGPGRGGMAGDRDFSDIEVSLLTRQYKNIIPFLRDAWANVADLSPEFEYFETKNGVSRLMPLDDIVVVVGLDVRLQDIAGTVTLCVPFEGLASVNDKLSIRYCVDERTKNTQDAETVRQSICAHLNRSGVEVSAVLGEAMISLKDLLHLEPGDVIRLNRKQTDLAKVNVNRKTRFYGRLGVLSNVKAIEIIRSVE